MQPLLGRGLDSLGRSFDFVKRLLTRWSQDRVSSYAASLAYYSIFALTPLIIIVTSFIGLTIGKNVAETRIIETAALLMGDAGAQQLQTMIVSSATPMHGITAEIISFIILLVGASGIFTQIQIGLNAIFPNEPQKQQQRFLKLLIDRFFSLALVLGVAFLLLVSLMFSATLTFFSNYLSSLVPIGVIISWLLDFIISFITITFLFALLYKYLPDLKLSWSEVRFGSMIAAFLFILGKFILGIYLGKKHVGNAFGPAGSLVIILIWLYYSAQLLFLGAEIIMIKKMNQTVQGI